MLADLPSKFVWPHEDNPQERLLLDPLPQEEMNRIMLRRKCGIERIGKANIQISRHDLCR